MNVPASSHFSPIEFKDPSHKQIKPFSDASKAQIQAQLERICPDGLRFTVEPIEVSETAHGSGKYQPGKKSQFHQSYPGAKITVMLSPWQIGRIAASALRGKVSVLEWRTFKKSLGLNLDTQPGTENNSAKRSKTFPENGSHANTPRTALAAAWLQALQGAKKELQTFNYSIMGPLNANTGLADQTLNTLNSSLNRPDLNFSTAGKALLAGRNGIMQFLQRSVNAFPNIVHHFKSVQKQKTPQDKQSEIDRRIRDFNDLAPILDKLGLNKPD